MQFKGQVTYDMPLSDIGFPSTMSSATPIIPAQAPSTSVKTHVDQTTSSLPNFEGLITSAVSGAVSAALTAGQQLQDRSPPSSPAQAKDSSIAKTALNSSMPPPLPT